MPQVRHAGTPSVDAIVRDLYGSLSDDTSFRPCLRAVGPAFRSHITGLHHEELLARASGLEMMGEIDGDEFQRLAGDYSQRWLGKNLWIERGIETLMTRGYGVGDENVTRRELHESEYFCHFLRPVDIHYGLGINIQTDGLASLAIMSINRSASMGEFSADELRLVDVLRPHLVNAFAICKHMQALRDEAEGMRACFDRSPVGIVVLDAEGRVVERNIEAAKLLHAGTQLTYGAAGGLHFSQASLQARYRALIAQLTDPRQPPQPTTLVVPPGGASATGLALHLCAFPENAAPMLRPRGRLLGFLCELTPQAEHALAANVLRTAFGFTPTEAEVVLALRDHHELPEAALALGVAISTVRSHLKHVFSKSGVAKQGELLRLVDRVLGSLPH